MKKQHIFSALLAFALLPFSASSAIAQSLSPIDENPTGWYGSLAPAAVFGYSVDVDTDAFTVEVPPVLGIQLPPQQIAPIEISVDTDLGYGINGAVGYQFEDARVELEGGYNSNSVNSIDVDGIASADVDGRFAIWSLLANAYYDIPTQSPWRPYVGGGVGIANLAANDVSVEVPFVGQAELDDSGIGFIFQAQAGVAYDFSESTSAFVGYRLQGVPGTQFTVEGVDAEANTVYINSVQAGARVRF